MGTEESKPAGSSFVRGEADPSGAECIAPEDVAGLIAADYAKAEAECAAAHPITFTANEDSGAELNSATDTSVPAPEFDPNKPLTERDFRALRRMYFTVRHDVGKPCGHKVDRLNQPKNNCEYCWWIFFETHPDLVATADRAYIDQGREFLDRIRGWKFRKYFLRYMSTKLKIQQEQERINAENKSREETGGEGQEGSGLSVRAAEDQGTEVSSDQGTGDGVGREVRVEDVLTTGGQGQDVRP